MISRDVEKCIAGLYATVILCLNNQNLKRVSSFIAECEKTPKIRVSVLFWVTFSLD